MKKYFIYVLTLLTLVSVNATALATEHSARAYQIEVILFQNLQPDALSNEQWPAHPPLPSRVNALLPAGAASDSTDTNTSYYDVLSPANFILNSESRRLSNLNYPILLHQAWLLSGNNLRRAASYYLQSSNDLGATSVEGTIKVRKDRYFDLDTSLVLTIPNQALPENLRSNTADVRMFALSDNRRIKMGELVYIDHPAMGVLLRIVPR